jgi:TonB family protein
MSIQYGEERSERTRGFAVSALLHVAAIVVVIAGPRLTVPEDPRPVFNRQIRPYAEHLIWYNLRTKLPEVKPAERAKQRPPRARRIFRQQIVAGQIELPRPPQLIRVPAPEIRLAEALKLPNVLATAPAKPARPVRPFQAPPERARPAEERPLPAAPQIRTSAARHELTLDLAVPRPRPLPFVAPVARPAAPTPAELAAAPEVANAAPAMDMPRIPRGFTAPERKAKPADAADIELPSAAVAAAAQPQATVAIVGLNPIDTVDIPRPPRAHEAGFSAGPHAQPKGGTEAPPGRAVMVPDLMAHGGARSADPALMAALRPLTREGIAAELRASRGTVEPSAVEPAPARAVRAPDPRLDGRAVYAISIQMPNVTSFSGSWMVWFAEHRPLGRAPGRMQSPVALRKVDPKYYRESIHERVEGTVRLFAVIRKDGQVDAIEILHGIDGRLDRSAADALAKWQFEPAKRDGVAVDVDAVFEVPFRLAPKS